NGFKHHFWKFYCYLSTASPKLSTDTHRSSKPELCLLPSVDSPFLAVDSTCPALYFSNFS
ncbi:hypothetical protein Taro_021961, partial [Colocasia esculenta]|nr:hypothetical protein [Colocasia esculenta]